MEVAIIGGGPSGLIAAKCLADEGIAFTVFECSGAIGGHWNVDGEKSAMWTSLRANTSSLMTSFSCLRHDERVLVFPRGTQIRQYLERFTDEFKLRDHIKLNAEVVNISRDPTSDGYEVMYNENGAQRLTNFSHLIVASGRFNKPWMPEVTGFVKGGPIEMVHARDYKGPEMFAGKRVLVVGSSVSAYEIGGDIANDSKVKAVTSICRNPRYVLHKAHNGIPIEGQVFTRTHELVARHVSAETASEQIKDFIVASNSDPSTFGAPKPHSDTRHMQVTFGSVWLQQVKDGRIKAMVAEIREVSGNKVFLSNGEILEVDSILMSTGYELNLPFLSRDLASTMQVDRDFVHMYQRTFHPDLPNLACIGLYNHFGPYFPVVELQSRWVAMVMKGIKTLPPREEQLASIARYKLLCQDKSQVRKEGFFHQNLLLFANLCGAEPSLTERPDLLKPLLFGPLAPSQFRISGHGAYPGAAEQFAEDAENFGLVPEQLDGPQLKTVELVAQHMNNPEMLEVLRRFQQEAGAAASSG